MASYSGDGTFAVSSGTVPQQVNLYSSTVALASSNNPSTYGQSVTFTATVSSSSPNAPTGSVTFKSGAYTLGVASISGGIATISTATLNAGMANVKASYSGDNANTGGSSSLSQTINASPVTVAVSSSLNPSIYGQSIAFTATLASSTGAAVSNGNVRFTSDGTTIGGCAAAPIPSPNTATCVTSSLPAGSHSVVATYNPGPDFTAGSGLLMGVQTVKDAASTVALSSSSGGNAVNFGQTVSFTATVTSGTVSSVTGKVSFTSDSAIIAGCGAINLAAQMATCITSSLPAGTHTIIATYTGTPNIAPAGSAPLSQTVHPISSTTTLVSSSNPGIYEENTPIFTATVTSAAAVTGTVAFTDNGAKIPGCGAVSLVSGSARCGDSLITAGNHSINASYSGTASISVSSAAIEQVVKKVPMWVSLGSSANPSTSGQLVTFSASLGPPMFVNADTIQFTADGSVIPGCGAVVLGNSGATCVTGGLAVGTHTIVATFAGDSNRSSATDELMQTVNAP
jgi:hypothetical protein